MPAIRLDDVTFYYSGTEQCSLKNVCLEIDQGEFVAVIGANNSGKSSLCYALTGVIPHLYHGKLHGDIYLTGKSTKSMSVDEISRSAGLVMQIPQNQLSGVRYTVFEEVAFSLENRGIPRDSIKKRVAETLELTGLTNLAERCPQHLSGGQQQKVVLAAVLANDPDILILDEPTTFLDPQGTNQVFEILSQLKSRGKSIVIAEQNLELIALYADRVVTLHNGEIVLDGPPSQVLTDHRLNELGLDLLRYTKVAEQAAQNNMWNKSMAPAVTFSQTVRGLEVG
ncbi:ABC transporter ATP-binding protein [Maridesulfovibrio sp.]|uniref:energy-coupling factor ABC transporter ATP-binding protein n=1 Tax=Maridesulfovibrio sp. TaxID=2795000 RepID=UPI002A18CFB4|nr:ABC transporter ATP-binding protein [Maridesulfovibrio sp.]